MTVGIIYQLFSYPNLYRQTPHVSGMWNNVRFLINELSEPCDILLVLNRLYEAIEVTCGEVWLLVQEPPIDYYHPWIFEGQDAYSRVYSPYCPGRSPYCTASHGALPWHIEKTYDELKILSSPVKNKTLSWITSDKVGFKGRKERMNFLKSLTESNIEFDLYGKGFRPIADKYEGLAQYRYSLAIENHSAPHYWTEKIADCFLSWTMPIYYGCSNLDEYFPRESFVQIDIHDRYVLKQISEVTETELYLKNRDAIAEARRLVLDEYQLFPFIVKKIKESETISINEFKQRTFYPYKESLKRMVKRKLYELFIN